MRSTLRTLFLHGGDILKSPGMQIAKENMQHGSVSVFEHSVCVALVCLWLVHRLHLKVNQRALVRGALLHDYFLYDWHTPDPAHRLHGFRHAGTALRNADRDFELNDTERDMIKKHMFPLNPAPPRFKETAVLCLADKYCALRETVLQRKKANKRKQQKLPRRKFAGAFCMIGFGLSFGIFRLVNQKARERTSICVMISRRRSPATMYSSASSGVSKYCSVSGWFQR